MNEKRLVPAFRNEYEIQSYSDSEKKKHAVCQIMVSKERIHDTRIEEKPMTSTKKFLLQQVKNSTRVIIDPNPTPHSRPSNLPPPIQKYSLQLSLPSTARYSSSSISKICSTQAQNLTQKQPRWKNSQLSLLKGKALQFCRNMTDPTKTNMRNVITRCKWGNFLFDSTT